jgi:hypothetical protein
LSRASVHIRLRLPYPFIARTSALEASRSPYVAARGRLRARRRLRRLPLGVGTFRLPGSVGRRRTARRDLAVYTRFKRRIQAVPFYSLQLPGWSWPR